MICHKRARLQALHTFAFERLKVLSEAVNPSSAESLVELPLSEAVSDELSGRSSDSVLPDRTGGGIGRKVTSGTATSL